MGKIKIKENPTKGFIYKSDLDYISKCILDFSNSETGGDIFGYWTQSGFPVINYLTGPGPKSFCNKAVFERDLDYFSLIRELLNKNYALEHIGSWYSQGGLVSNNSNSYDLSTMVNTIENTKVGRFMMITTNINEDKSTAIKGSILLESKKKKIKSSQVSWVILDSDNPITKDFVKKQSGIFVYQPLTKEPVVSVL